MMLNGLFVARDLGEPLSRVLRLDSSQRKFSPLTLLVVQYFGYIGTVREPPSHGEVW